MSSQSSFEKEPIHPVVGLLRERHGRKTKINAYKNYLGWFYEDTRHNWRRSKWKRAKKITLRTHRTGR